MCRWAETRRTSEDQGSSDEGAASFLFKQSAFRASVRGLENLNLSNAAFFFLLNTIPSVGLMHGQLHKGLSINILMSRGCEILLLWQEVFRAIINRGGNFNPNIITSLKLSPSASLMSSVELKSWKQQGKKKNHKTSFFSKRFFLGYQGSEEGGTGCCSQWTKEVSRTMIIAEILAQLWFLVCTSHSSTDLMLAKLTFFVTAVASSSLSPPYPTPFQASPKFTNQL